MNQLTKEQKEKHKRSLLEYRRSDRFKLVKNKKNKNH